MSLDAIFKAILKSSQSLDNCLIICLFSQGVEDLPLLFSNDHVSKTAVNYCI